MPTHDHWWKDANIYELYIDLFAGTIPNLTTKLPYFTELGINCLHLLPFYPSPMVDDGYDVADYRTVRPDLGTLDDFTALMEAARARGMRIIIDFVLNHTSKDHPWFVEARSSKHNPKRDYYLWREIDYGYEGATNAFPDIKPSNWIRNEATEDYYFATFYPEQPDLNWDNPEVEATMLDTMSFWANMGVDGFRLDAAPYLIKRENTSSRGLAETHQVLKRIRTHLNEHHPGVIMLAEAHQSLALSKEYFGDGDECHMAYHFPLMEQLWMSMMEGAPERALKMAEESADIPPGCQWATFLRNHDEVSLLTLPPQEREQLVAYLDPLRQYPFSKQQTTSVRLATGLHNDQAKIREALALLYSLPGAPVMYYGDEIGMQNQPLQEGVVDTRRYVRGEFDWQEAERQKADKNSLWHYAAAHIKRAPTPSPLSKEGELL